MPQLYVRTIPCPSVPALISQSWMDSLQTNFIKKIVFCVGLQYLWLSYLVSMLFFNLLYYLFAKIKYYVIVIFSRFAFYVKSLYFLYPGDGILTYK